jgi:hemerythrin-like domain-containing protein
MRNSFRVSADSRGKENALERLSWKQVDKGVMKVRTKCVSQLKADHQWILQALDVLREMAQQLETYGMIARKDVLTLLEFLRKFAHEYHDAKEQILLVHAVRDARITLDQRTLDGIAADHDRHICTAVDALRAALIERNDKEFVELATTYIELMTTHIFNEDHFLFDTIEEGLTTDCDEQLIKAFDEFDVELREYSRAKFEQVVRTLGRKYCVPQCV